MRSSEEHGGWRRTKFLLRALRSRNYRLFFAGQSVSLVGTWMQQVAMSWLVYRLTGSAWLLGVVGFTSQVPSFLLSPFAGVLADRWNRRHLLVTTQSLAMLQAAVLAAVVLAGVVKVWQIVALSLILGIVNAFDIPVRQSFVVELVDDRSDLGNAIALNSSMVNGARLIGPSIAGLLVSAVGEGICFVINSASYLAVILALTAMRLTPRQPRQKRRRIHLELLEGLSYSFGFTPIRNILLLVALISLVGMPYAVLLPVFARDVFHGSAHTYGFLMTASGLGAFASTVYLASRKTVLGLGRIIPLSAALFGAGVSVLALSSSFVIALTAISVAGFGVMAQVASSNTILQTIVEEDKRGRVMSLFAMAFMGMTPFGSLAAGALAGSIGPRETILAGGIACLAGAVLFALRLPALRVKVRPIYVQMGIIREVATGLETAVDQAVPPEETADH